MNRQERNWMSPRNLIIAVIVVSLPFAIYLSNRAISGEQLVVGQRVENSRLASIDSIKHDLWDDLVREFVDGNGNVDYRSWSKNKKARVRLEKYFRHLSSANPAVEATRGNRLAFWINAYNAVTIHGILREYPTESIRNHTSRIGGYNIWYDLKLIVGSEKYSLHQIEHEILRKMDEPRIHFAIVCASKSCPRILNRAFVGKEIDNQLNANTRHFLSNANNFRYSEPENAVYLSSIFSWFGDDFGKNNIELLKFIKPYLSADQSRFDIGTARIRYQKYDWSLNEQ